MSSALASRRKTPGTRRPIKLGTSFTGTEQATLGSSPSLAAFRSLLEQFVRAGGVEIHRLRDEVIARIRRARDPGRWVNELIDECINRGGPDGLVKAVEVLARIDPSIITAEAIDFFSREFPRWRVERQTNSPRYGVRDEVCYIFLRAICQTTEFRSAFPFVSRALTLGPDGVREGIAAAISDLGNRFPEKKPLLIQVVQGVLDAPSRLPDKKFTTSSRNAFTDTLSDLGA